MGLFTASENLPFTIAIAVMIGLAVMEGAITLFGGSLSHWLDHFVPDGSVEQIDVGNHAHGGGILGWLHLGQVPLLILLIVFLTAFGMCGLIMQILARSVLGSYLPGIVVSIPAFLAALPVVRVGGAVIARIMPKDESSAVTEESLVGRAGVIITGTARKGVAAQVRLRDQYGQHHYVMVEPDNDESFPSGTEVLLVKRVGSRYLAIRNPHPELLQP